MDKKDKDLEKQRRTDVFERRDLQLRHKSDAQYVPPDYQGALIPRLQKYIKYIHMRPRAAARLARATIAGGDPEVGLSKYLLRSEGVSPYGWLGPAGDVLGVQLPGITLGIWWCMDCDDPAPYAIVHIVSMASRIRMGRVVDDELLRGLAQIALCKMRQPLMANMRRELWILHGYSERAASGQEPTSASEELIDKMSRGPWRLFFREELVSGWRPVAAGIGEVTIEVQCFMAASSP